MAKTCLIFRIILMFLMMTGATAQASAAYRLVLPETLVADGPSVTVADLSSSPVPGAIGDVVIMGRGKAGSSTTITRQVILRKLVQSGLARGVVFDGADQVLVSFEGREISPEVLREEIMKQVNSLLPTGQTGAPGAWVELQLPETKLALAGKVDVTIQRSNPLEPGRNQLRVRLKSLQSHCDLPVVAILHSFGEVPTAKVKIERETPLTEGLFNWDWLDLAELQGQPVTRRDALLGACAGRTLTSGDQLRAADLKPIPAINAGDMVDLEIQKGGLTVTVRGLARQAGCLGQTIPVRNELNGKLVNARVKGPGLVEWRK